MSLDRRGSRGKGMGWFNSLCLDVFERKGVKSLRGFEGGGVPLI